MDATRSAIDDPGFEDKREHSTQTDGVRATMGGEDRAIHTRMVAARIIATLQLAT